MLRVPKAQVQVRVQVLRSQVQVPVQVLESICQVQSKYRELSGPPLGVYILY